MIKQPSRKTKPVRVFNHKDWQSCYDDFLRSLGNKSGSMGTARVYACTLKRFFRDPKRSPDQYTRSEIEAFLHAPTAGNRLSGTVAKPGTFNSRLAHIRSFYQYAADYTVLFRGKMCPLLRGANPTRGIQSVQRVQQNRTLSIEEIERIFEVIPRNTIKGRRDRALFLCYFFTARRRAEIIRMRWKDIEQHVRFDDGHVGTLYHWRGKGRARQDDSAELLAPAWDAIRAYLELDGRWEQMAPNDAIFVSVANSQRNQAPEPLAENSINVIFREYLALAGIDPDGGRISIHSWRHSAAFVRYKEDRDILKLRALLRHRDLNDTQKYVEEWERQPDTAAAALAAKYGHF